MVGAAVKTPVPPTQQMNKPKPTAPLREGGSSSRRSGRPLPLLRIGVSLLIVWHFLGIFLAALSIGITSDLVLNVAQKPPMQWYLDALYLNQGHSFFAPEVGPGHLIRYQLLDQSGRVIEQGELPNRKEHWPRLFYHRHFMLADQSDFPTDNSEMRLSWQKRYLDAFGDHLLRVNENAQSVRLQRIAHWPLPSYYVNSGLKSVQRDIEQLDAQKRTAEADELSANLVKEAIARGYFGFEKDFPREMQGRHIDRQGYELLGETTRSRRELGPEPGKQASNWQYNQPQYNQPQYGQPQYNQPQSNQPQYSPDGTARRWTGGPR